MTCDRDTRALEIEFAQSPYGRHSDPLQRLLTHLRSEPYDGHLVLVQMSRFGPFHLARLGKKPGDPIAISDDTFDSREAAERRIFALRLERHLAPRND